MQNPQINLKVVEKINKVRKSALPGCATTACKAVMTPRDANENEHDKKISGWLIKFLMQYAEAL